jgi:putative phosphoribosyl transferase
MMQTPRTARPQTSRIAQAGQVPQTTRALEAEQAEQAEQGRTISLPLQDRHAAGEALAGLLHPRPGAVVLALPRGGVPVAVPIARALHLPLDVLIVRKLGVPGSPELAAGAIASGGVRVLNPDWASALDEHTLESIARREGLELVRRERAYRIGRLPLVLSGRPVILVDDGAATGASLAAAISAARGQGAARIVVAVPVAAPDTAKRLSALADEFVCLATPDPFVAVGPWYRHFGQVDDATALALLAEYRSDALTAGARGD